MILIKNKPNVNWSLQIMYRQMEVRLCIKELQTGRAGPAPNAD